MNETTADPTAQANAIVPFDDDLVSRAEQFREALPAHVPVERFLQIIQTAVAQNPKLKALNRLTRRSLWVAAMKCARDGLMPDGREAAFVIFSGKGGDVVQYMPMIAGIRKKVRQSNEIATWETYVVHKNDHFEYELGDNPRLVHRPAMTDAGPMVAVYSIAVLKTGEKSREFMTREEVEKVRAVSKAKDSGPWVSWYEEMARKTVARRHSKVLPMAADLEFIFRRDEQMFQDEAERAEVKKVDQRTLSEKMAALAGPTEDNGDDDYTDLDQDGDVVDKKTGEATKPAAPQTAAAAPEATATPSSSQKAVEPASGATNTAQADPASAPPKEEPPAATAPAAAAPAAGAGPALKLTTEQAAKVRKFADMLMGAQSQRTVQKGTVNFLEDEGFAEGSDAETAVVAIRDAHLARVAGKGSPGECDMIRDRFTRL